MLYYILLYLVQKYFVNHIGKVLTIVVLLSLAVYICWFPYKYETSSKGLYGISDFSVIQARSVMNGILCIA